MSNYLIKLFPLGKFFFGGDMMSPVGEDEKDEFNQEFASYIITSNQFPQQTSLLGMLRYQILVKSPDVFCLKQNKITKSEKAGELIGKNSFTVNPNGNNFGKIKSLSPCYLMKGDDWLLPAPKDYNWIIDFSESEDSCVYNGRHLRVPLIKGYDPKRFEPKTFINRRTRKVVKDSDIFQEDLRIGINKSYDGRTSEKGFYKQISYRLKDGYCFAFSVDVDFDLMQCNGDIVNLGGDNSIFSMYVCKVSSDVFSLKSFCLKGEDKNSKVLKEVGKECDQPVPVILLSDSYITDENLERVVFQVTDTISFRFLESKVDSKNYNVLSREVMRSKKYQLYAKGSVFYFATGEDASEFVSQIEKRKDFKDIGYNNAFINRG